jgi:hypothetical protein
MEKQDPNVLIRSRSYSQIKAEVYMRHGKQDPKVAAETRRGMTYSSPLLPDIDGH